jgi:hypothetical protein
VIVNIHATQDQEEPRLINVWVGDLIIKTLKPVARSKAGDGDDTAYWDSEDRRVIEETVAEWLAGALR